MSYIFCVEQLIEQMVEQAEQLENAEGDPVGNNGSWEGSVSGESGKRRSLMHGLGCVH